MLGEFKKSDMTQARSLDIRAVALISAISRVRNRSYSMITPENYVEVESSLNAELKEQSGYEDWMYFSIKPIDGAPDRFTVGYLLPTSHGVSTDKDLEECMEIYNPVLKKVLS